MQYLYAFFISFFIGAIPFSYIVGYMAGHVDIRRIGSKNAGAGNVFHLFGIGPGLIALLGDLGKGVLSLFIVDKLFYFQPFEIVVFGFVSVLGHVFSPFLRFKGGKGAATTIGVFLFVIFRYLGVKGFYLFGILVALWLVFLSITHSQVVSIAMVFPIFPFLLLYFYKDMRLFDVSMMFVLILEYIGRESFKRELKASYEKYLKKLFKRSS